MRTPVSLGFYQHNKGLNTRNPGFVIANKVADQLALTRSLISTFVIGYLKNKVIGWISLNTPFFCGLQPQGVGGTLIFSYIRRLGSFFGVQNFEFQYSLGFSEK